MEKPKPHFYRFAGLSRHGESPQRLQSGFRPLVRWNAAVTQTSRSHRDKNETISNHEGTTMTTARTIDVPSESNPRTSYRVTIHPSGAVRCTCPASLFRPGQLCRHGRHVLATRSQCIAETGDHEQRIRAAWRHVQEGAAEGVEAAEAKRLIHAFLHVVKAAVLQAGNADLHRLVGVIGAANQLCLEISRVDQDAAETAVQAIGVEMDALAEMPPNPSPPSGRPPLVSGNLKLFG